jgi:hypothetical protein
MVISKFYYKIQSEDPADGIRKILEPVLDDLGLGELNRIDVVKTPSDHFKVFIHYSSTSPNATRLRTMLDDNDRFQKEGKPIQPVKILYEKTRDGRPRYWYVYKADTPEERLAKMTKTKFTPVIEYGF